MVGSSLTHAGEELLGQRGGLDWYTPRDRLDSVQVADACVDLLLGGQ